jgi:outer membrane protein
MTQRVHARPITCALSAVLALFATGSVQAQSAGAWLLRAGATQIKPNVDSGDLSPPALAGSKANIGSSTGVSAGVTYMLTDHISVDVPLAFPFKHEMTGDGSIAGAGKIGEVKAAPMTVLGQYRFLEPTSAFRPYLGAGLSYVKFFKAKGTAALTAFTGGTPANPTTLSVESKFAATVQIGATYAFDAHWFVDATVLRTFLKTRTTLSTGQTLDARLDPTSVSLAVGYVF